MEKSPFTFFEKRFHHFFLQNMKMQMKNVSQKKKAADFSILNGDFSIQFFSEVF